jgi:microcystin-dependent protein
MAEPFIGEIRIAAFNIAPTDWALCNGQLLPINQNQALFSILGTTYGGDGRTNFALPNLQGRVPLHQGNSYVLGQSGGEATHTLTVAEMPAHSHTLTATTAVGNTVSPVNGVFARPVHAATSRADAVPYGTTAGQQMAKAVVANSGAGQPHENRPPFLVVNYIIALVGIFPSQS